MVASATRYPGSTRRVFRKSADWQTEAWRFYDITGELRYAANWIANITSRATLHAAERTPVGLKVVENGPAADAMEDLFDGKDGQAQMLSAIAIHLFVAGECYLVGRKPDTEKRMEPKGDDIWEIVGTQEMKHRGARWSIDYSDGLAPLNLDDDAVIIRIWRPHPRRRIDADSPVRAMLGVLQELEFLGRHVMAQITSRLAGGGILLLPQGMTFPAPPEDSGLPEGATSAEVYMSMLGEAMIAAVTDPGSPAALVPIVTTAPDEAIDKIKHLTFWSSLDEHAVELRNEAIRRLALGLDMPPEVLLGTADVNHWGAWQIEESSIKATVEPLLELIVNALSVGYLQPITDVDTDVVAYDTSALRLRPNRSKEAIELYDRGELDGDALRRETGFDRDDAPDPAEYKQWVLRKIALGSATPEMMAEALRALEIMDHVSVDQSVTESPPAPSLRDHPEDELPDTEAASLYDKSEVLVYRALERAGNRLRSLKQMRPECAAADTYLFVRTEPGELDKVLDDAWTCIPRVLSNLPEYQQKVVVHALDTYARHLLLTRTKHTREEMLLFLNGTAIRTLEG